MFNSGIIDLALTLAFTFFVLALISSTIVEIIHNARNLRGKQLIRTMKELYDDPKWAEIMDSHILNDPYIKSLYSNVKRYPSYIPARNYSQSILNLLNSKIENPNSKADIVPIFSNDMLSSEDIKTLLKNSESIIPESVRNSMFTLLIQANGDVDKFLDNIGGFYNNSVDRVTGWFKRHTQMYLFVLGLTISIFFNVDTLYLTKSLWANKEKLKATADLISQTMPQITALNSSVNKVLIDTSKTVQTKSSSLKTDSTKSIQANLNNINEDTLKIIQANITNLKKEIDMLDNLPIGYSDPDNNIFQGNFYTDNWFIKLLSKIFGFLLTTLAIYLGAPFWFDLLNKFVNMRGSGTKPPEKKDL